MQISNSNSRNNSKPKRSDCSGHVSKLGLGLLAMCQAKSSQVKPSQTPNQTEQRQIYKQCSVTYTQNAYEKRVIRGEKAQQSE